MTFTLPDLPRTYELSFEDVTAGGDLPASLGGSDIRITRLGDKTAVMVSLPVFGLDCGRQWVAAMRSGKTEPARLKLPVPADIGNPGTPLVKGASQAGMSLLIDGLTVGYEILAGSKLSLVISGRRYLYFATADVTANGSGEATVALSPMLRVSPPDNAVVEIAQPYIEGLIKPVNWSEGWTETVGPIQFRLVEVR